MPEPQDGFLEAFDSLLKLSFKQGYLLFDDIFPCLDRYNLDIQDIDRLTSKILDNGIILYENKPSVKKSDSESQKDEFDDFAHSDYEPVYSKIVELDSSQNFFVDYVRKLIPPQRREMQQLQYQMIEGNLFARKRVIEMHLRLALKLALQYSEKYGCDIKNMISLACEGLCIAADNYKPDINSSFSGYASRWIMQMINRNKSIEETLWRFPVHFSEGQEKIYKYIRQTHKEFFTSDSFETDKLSSEIAEYFDIPKKTSLHHLQFLLPMIKYDELENIPNDGSFTKKIENIDFSERLNKTLDYLKTRERQVLKLRYGLYNETDFDYKYIVSLVNRKIYKNDGSYNYGLTLTLEEIGTLFGVTRERVRQIEVKGLRHLKINLYR